jgi:hypothetical protein
MQDAPLLLAKMHCMQSVVPAASSYGISYRLPFFGLQDANLPLAKMCCMQPVVPAALYKADK